MPFLRAKSVQTFGVLQHRALMKATGPGKLAVDTNSFNVHLCCSMINNLMYMSKDCCWCWTKWTYKLRCSISLVMFEWQSGIHAGRIDCYWYVYDKCFQRLLWKTPMDQYMIEIIIMQQSLLLWVMLEISRAQKTSWGPWKTLRMQSHVP